MNNYIFKFCLLLFTGFFITTTIFRFIFRFFDNGVFDILMVSFINSVFFAGIYGLFIYFDMKPKIRFLTSSVTNLPRFGSKSQISFPVDNNLFSFEKVISSMNKDYVIDYVDINEGILKFHSKMRIWHPLLGCFIQWDGKLSVVSVNCFPIIGGFSSKTTRKVNEFCEFLKSEIIIK